MAQVVLCFVQILPIFGTWTIKPILSPTLISRDIEAVVTGWKCAHVQLPNISALGCVARYIYLELGWNSALGTSSRRHPTHPAALVGLGHPSDTPGCSLFMSHLLHHHQVPAFSWSSLRFCECYVQPCFGTLVFLPQDGYWQRDGSVPVKPFVAEAPW